MGVGKVFPLKHLTNGSSLIVIANLWCQHCHHTGQETEVQSSNLSKGYTANKQENQGSHPGPGAPECLLIVVFTVWFSEEEINTEGQPKTCGLTGNPRIAKENNV